MFDAILDDSVSYVGTMTFVLNLLHTDYSLLVVDRKAQTNGPITPEDQVTVETGGQTIHIQRAQSLIIEGVQKLFYSKDRRSVIGAAGTYGNHGYLSAFQQSASPADALALFTGPIALDHAVIANTNCTDVTSESGILTYFEPQTERFFSCVFLFSVLHRATYLYSGNTDVPQVFHTGSGGQVFQSDKSKDAVQRFDQIRAKIRSKRDVERHFEHIIALYRAASQVDPGTGENPQAVIATRNNPQFVEVKAALS